MPLPSNAASSKRGGIGFKLLVFVAGVAAVAALAWMLFLPLIFTGWLRRHTGFEATVQSLMVNPFTGQIRIKNLEITNPPTFAHKDFLDLASLEVDTSLLSLLSDHPVVDRIELELRSVALVRRADGKTNAEVMRHYLAGPSEGRPVLAKEGEGKEFLIKYLHIIIGRLVTVDERGALPYVRELPLKLDQTFHNVSDSRELRLPTSLDQLFDLGAAVSDLLPGDVDDAVERTLKTGSNAVRQAGEKSRELWNRAVDTLEESKKP